MARSGNTTQINVSIPNGLKGRLLDEAKAVNRSLSNFVAILLIEAMEKIRLERLEK